MSETWFRVSFYLAMLALGFGGPLVIDWALGGPVKWKEQLALGVA